MTVLTLKKTKTENSVTTIVQINATNGKDFTNVSIETSITTEDAYLFCNCINPILKRVFGEKAQYRCSETYDTFNLDITLIAKKEFDFVKLCALEDVLSCTLDKLQNVVKDAKSLNHVAEDLYGTICNYGKSKKPATPEKKTNQE